MELIKSQYAHGTPGHIREAEYFYYDTSPQHTEQFAVVCGGHELCAEDFKINRQSYPYFVVEYGIRGRGFLEIEGTEYELTSGVIAGFAPGMSHSYRVESKDPLEHIFLVITGSKANSVLNECRLLENGAIMSHQPQRTLEIFSNIMDAGLEKSPFSQQLCCSYLKVALYEQAVNEVKNTGHRSESERTYHKCRSHIDKNFSEIVSVSEVAAKCNVNIRYMARLFRAYGNLTPHEYIMRLKMNRAGQLLLNSELPVKTIAKLVGYEDPYHFSRNFSKFHKISPKLYRIKHITSL